MNADEIPGVAGKVDPMQLDIACAVMRIEQAHALPLDDPLRDALMIRLIGDALRLRRYLTHETLTAMDEVSDG